MEGVASALGHALSIPVGLIRLGFVVSCFFHLAGPLAYAVLWVVIPENLGQASALQRGFVKAEAWAAILAGEGSAEASQAPPSQAGGSLGSPTVLDGTDGER